MTEQESKHCTALITAEGKPYSVPNYTRYRDFKGNLQWFLVENSVGRFTGVTTQICGIGLSDKYTNEPHIKYRPISEGLAKKLIEKELINFDIDGLDSDEVREFTVDSVESRCDYLLQGKL